PAPATPGLKLTAIAVTIGPGPKPAAPADVWLARYDPRTRLVAIHGGENGGKTLPHRNIVRELVRLGGWSGAAETLPLPPPREGGLNDVVLVQLPKGGPILAAAKG